MESRAPKAVVPDRTKTVRAILAAGLAVTPLALMNGVFLSHEVIPKVILILASAAAALFLLPEWRPSLLALWARREGRIFLSLVLAQAVSLALSTVFSSYPALSLAGTVWRRFGLLEQAGTLTIATGIACLAAARPSFAKNLMRAAIAAGGVAALYGTLQYFGFDPFLWSDLYSPQYLGSVVRPPSTLGHAIYFSAYLVPIAIVAAASCRSEARGMWKWVAGSVALLACLAILLAGSRGAVLAAGGGGLLLAWRLRLKFSARLVLAVVLLLAMLIAAALSPAGENFRLRLQQWRADMGGTRAGVWRETPGLIAKHPWLGSGPETFAMEFRAVQSAALSRAYPDFYQETPHNAFLDAASAQGIPGLLILAGAFALGLFPLRKRPPELQAALLGILMASMFASLTLVTSMYLWTVAGLAVALSTDQPATERRSASSPNLFYYPAWAWACVLLGAAIVFCVQDRAYARVQNDVDGKNTAAAVRDYGIATRFSLGMPGYALWSSREFATLRAWSESAEAASLAERQSEERFTAAYQSAVLAVAAGDVTRAEAKARESIGMAPNWYKPHLLLAQILQATGRNEEAAEQARIGRNLGWRG